ncbi:MAG: hypothetical protein KJO18_01870, partial [Acidimicrobiia bacterium]|nr:hypothetical protein [Acidimicrobiia bacterium]
IPPFELPQLFERARSIQLASGGMVLVPCPEDYLLMVAEKVQRKGDYSMRRVRDVLTVIESEESIDWAHVRAECRRLHIGLGLGWLLDRVEASRPGSIGDPADARYRLAGWERRFQAVISGATGASVAGRRRARSMHRRIWVTRYVLTHSTKAAALVEVGSGRYRTTIAGVPESWSATL